MSKTVFIGKAYNIELNENNQFVLVHPVGEDEVYDSFDELAEENPICEEARSFFFGGSEDVKFSNTTTDRD